MASGRTDSNDKGVKVVIFGFYVVFYACNNYVVIQELCHTAQGGERNALSSQKGYKASFRCCKVVAKGVFFEKKGFRIRNNACIGDIQPPQHPWRIFFAPNKGLRMREGLCQCVGKYIIAYFCLLCDILSDFLISARSIRDGNRSTMRLRYNRR